MAGTEQRAGASRPLTHRDVLTIALPIIVSNMTTPLIGVVDTAVIGQLGDAAQMGGVAVAATIFSLLFWSFGFLRMGTSGLTAQADGRRDTQEVAATLQRALAVGLATGLVLIVLQWPILAGSLLLIEGSDAVEAATRTYYAIRIWSSPLTLANFALLGWLVGLGRAGQAFALQLVLNLTNIGLDLALVLHWQQGIAGVAWATVAAEAVALVLGLVLATRELSRRGGRAALAQTFDRAQLRRTLVVNGDIMVRTLCLQFAFTFFTAVGARAGDVTLAANAILLALFDVTAYVLDGFAHAAEVFAGRAVGARARARFAEAVRLTSLHAGLLATMVSVLTYFGGNLFIDLVTTSQAVRAEAKHFMVWVAIAPLLGVGAFVLDGIFIGATRTADMRNMMFISLAAFLVAWVLLRGPLGNHGLWAALMVFFVVRGVTLAACLPRLTRAAFGDVRA